MADDFALLDAWGEGDTRAADKLFARYFDPLYRFFAPKAPEAIEDLMQDTFTACVGSRSRFRRDASFRAFLFGTARNILLRHYRTASRREVSVDPEQSSVADMDPSPSKMLVKKREERLLLEALRRIPIDYQIAIELYDWEELSGPEVAEVLGLGEAAFRSRLYRAKQELRRQMEEIADNGELLQSTMAGLADWARSLREQLGEKT